MRVLLLVDYFADPPVIGTSVIVRHWARLLRARGHDVELLCACDDPSPAWDDYLGSTGVRLAPVAPPRRRRWRMALAPFAGLPPSLLRVPAGRFAESIAGAGRYDAAVVVGPSLFPIAERLQRRMRTLFVPVDAISMALGGRTNRWPHLLDWLRWRVESRLWRRLEARGYRRLDAVVFVADADAEEAARAWPAAERDRVHVIPNGVDADHFRPTGEPERPDELVFSGNLWTYDSVVGALWFIERVLPELARSGRAVRLRLVGRNPAAELVEAARRNPRIEVHGDVPDLRPYLDRAAVYVCPLHSGAGVKNRLLEALAMARPAVATSSCAGPLGLVSGEHLLVADEPAAFAAAVGRLLDDAGLRQSMGRRARDVVLERLSWDAGVERLEALLAP